MRRGLLTTSLILSALMLTGAVAGATTPAQSPALTQSRSALDLPGDSAGLEAILGEAGPVRYRIIRVDENPADRTAYLDRYLEQSGWPAADELLLLLFPQGNWDLRFAMGANFRQQQFTVEEMLTTLRLTYFPRSQQGDVAGGLASLVRAVNRQMAVGEISLNQARYDALHQVVGLLQQRHVESLMAMIAPEGLHVAPYGVGLPETGLSPASAGQVLKNLVVTAEPMILAYGLEEPGVSRIVIDGLPAGLSLPASGAADSRITSTSLAQLTLKKVGTDWRLASIAFDPHGLLAGRLAESPTSSKPFGWWQVRTAGPTLSLGFGAADDGRANTTQQVTTSRLAEATTFLSHGVSLPASLEGSHMVIYRSLSADYEQLSTSLLSLDPSFSAYHSPTATHTGFLEYNPELYTVTDKQLTIKGRPALLVSADEKREGGWRNRHLVIWSGEWLYHLEDGQGDVDRLLKLAAEIK